MTRPASTDSDQFNLLLAQLNTTVSQLAKVYQTDVSAAQLEVTRLHGMLSLSQGSMSDEKGEGASEGPHAQIVPAGKPGRSSYAGIPCGSVHIESFGSLNSEWKQSKVTSNGTTSSLSKSSVDALEAELTKEASELIPSETSMISDSIDDEIFNDFVPIETDASAATSRGAKDQLPPLPAHTPRYSTVTPAVARSQPSTVVKLVGIDIEEDEPRSSNNRGSSMSDFSPARSRASSVARTVVFQMRAPWTDEHDNDKGKLIDLFIVEGKSGNPATPTSWQSASGMFILTSTAKEDNKTRYWYMMHPESRFRGFWILASMFLLMYDLVMVPVDVCFDLEEATWSTVIDFLALVFWTMDVVLTFLTGTHQVTHLELRPIRVAMAYIKTWFLFDVCIVAPEWVMLLMAGEDDDGDSGGQVSIFRLARWTRLVRLLRVARVLRPARIRTLVRHMANTFHLSKVYMQLTNAYAYVFLSGVLIVFMHVQSCFWYAVGNGLERGWVKSNDLGDVSVGTAYIASVHWSFSRLHGMKSMFRMESSMERFLDSILIFLSLLISSYFYGTIATVTITKATSPAKNLWKLGMGFVQRNRISPSLELKLTKVLDSKFGDQLGIGGTGAVGQEESQLLAGLPRNLQQDLAYEARSHYLLVKIFFNEMHQCSPRTVRHICSEAMTLRSFAEGEVVFAHGDPCARMLFVTTGVFFYLPDPSLQPETMVTMLQGMKKSMHPKLSMKARLVKGQALSEPILWTNWTHVGCLMTLDESVAVSLTTAEFFHVIKQHQLPLLHAVRYAKRFVWHLNHCEEQNDLVEFPSLTMEALDESVGDDDEHVMFISHYKLEAGTEASLMRDLLVDLLKQEVGHPANDLRSPIFVDSEDLDDLAGLKEHVKKSETLVLLLTDGVLSRPWCLVEIVTAVRFGCNILPVEIQRPGSKYQYPTEDFYLDLRKGRFLNESAVELLHDEGIGVEDVEKAIRDVFLKIALPFSPHKTKAIREAELLDILKRCGATDAKATWSRAKTKTQPL